MSSFNKKNKGGPLGSPTSSKRKSSGKRGNDEADEELKGVEALSSRIPSQMSLRRRNMTTLQSKKKMMMSTTMMVTTRRP